MDVIIHVSIVIVSKRDYRFPWNLVAQIEWYHLVDKRCTKIIWMQTIWENYA